MKREFLDQRPKFGLLFVGVFAVTAPVVLVTFAPWKWDLPLVSRVAGCVGLPVIVSIPVYVLAYFVRGLFRREVGRQELSAFLIAMAYVSAGAVALVRVDALRNYQAVGTAVLACTAILLFKVIKALGNDENRG